MTEDDFRGSPSQPPSQSAISIQEIIQIRAILGSEEQVPSTKLTTALDNLDTIILDFTASLSNKGN